ncbi:MAG TPA: hypothetical protein VIB79_15335 [Candidatus Binatia bacterium]
MANYIYVRFVLIACGGLSLLIGLWMGLTRLGWELPLPTPSFPILHGPIMIVGFLGTLITLERAAAMDQGWSYGAPVFAVVAVVAIVAGLPVQWAAAPAVISSAILCLIFIALYRQSPLPHFIVMAMSAGVWIAGNSLWLIGFPLYNVTAWWAAFLVLMIAGERLELSRLFKRRFLVDALFHLCVAGIVIALVYSIFDFTLGLRLAGIALACLAVWLTINDMARHTMYRPGLPRFMAICLIAGYFWLFVAGLLWLTSASQFVAGPRYDAMLHTIFLGFVFSMIFAHAPVIFPAISGINLPFSPVAYGYAGLLHVSLVLRVAGDLTLWREAQQWGGMLNVIAILLFLLSNVRAAIIGARGEGRTKGK